MLIYGNLCKSMQIRWVCGILKSTMTKSTWMETWNYIIRKCVETFKPVSNSYIFGQKHVSVSKLHCVEIACVEVTDTRDT